MKTDITSRLLSGIWKLLLILTIASTCHAVQYVSLENSAVNFYFHGAGILAPQDSQLIIFTTNHTFYTVSSKRINYDGSVTIAQPTAENQSTSISYNGFSSGTYTFEMSRTEAGVGLLTLNNGAPITMKYDTSGLSGEYYPGLGIGSFSVYALNAITGAANVSNRCLASSTYSPTTGFVLASTSVVLIRAVGGSLKQFSVADAVTNTKFHLYNGATMLDTSVATCVWNDTDIRSRIYTRIFTLLGAFQLSPSCTETVFFGVLNPGAYTVISNGGQESGEILTEVYVAACRK